MVDFQELRALVAQEIREETENTITEGLNEINFKGTVAYERDISNHTLTIYTNRPGIIIGKGGQGYDAFTCIIKNRLGDEWKLVIKEIRGDFIAVLQ